MFDCGYWLARAEQWREAAASTKDIVIALILLRLAEEADDEADRMTDNAPES